MLIRSKAHRILESLGNFPVVGILGPRQCGKTTLAKQLSEKLTKNVIYLDIESDRDRNVLNDPETYFREHEDSCIILDEIQLAPELFPILRSTIDTYKQAARFIILGSSSPKLIHASNESLAGRISYHELTPFLITEVDDDSRHRMWGGYPDCHLGPSGGYSNEWLENYVRSYAERDLPMMGLNTSASNIYRLLRMIAHLHSQLLNIQQLSKSLGISATSVKNYIDFLSEAFLVRLLPPYFYNTKKRLIRAPKIYIRDVGIFHSLAGITTQEELEFHPQLGDSWEGYVIEQVISSLPPSLEASFYRTQHGNEIDLIITKGVSVFAAIEIKNTLSPKPGKGFYLSVEELNPSLKLFIVPGKDSYSLQDNVQVMGLEEAIGLLNSTSQ